MLAFYFLSVDASHHSPLVRFRASLPRIAFVKKPALIIQFSQDRTNRGIAPAAAYSHMHERYKRRRFPDDTSEIHEPRLLRELTGNWRHLSRVCTRLCVFCNGKRKRTAERAKEETQPAKNTVDCCSTRSYRAGSDTSRDFGLCKRRFLCQRYLAERVHRCASLCCLFILLFMCLSCFLSPPTSARHFHSTLRQKCRLPWRARKADRESALIHLQFFFHGTGTRRGIFSLQQDSPCLRHWENTTENVDFSCVISHSLFWDAFKKSRKS